MHRNLRLFYILLFVTAAAAGLRYYSQKTSGELVVFESAAFALEDTTAVDRIFIADKDGNSALIERVPGQRYWSLNGKHLARKDAVDLLLKTFRRVVVQRPVPEAELDNVNRLLAGRAKKVEIYQGGTQPEKTWYIGTATQSHTGTYMVLGNGNGGIAEEPFVVHMEGFTGFLSTRFFTDESEWRYTGVFDYPGKSLRKVEVVYHETPRFSFAMEVDSNGDFSVLNQHGKAVVRDTLAWQDRFNHFKKIHLETFNHHLSPSGLDSLSNAAPAFTMRAWGMVDSLPTEINLFWKHPTMDTYDNEGVLNPWDGARMYAKFNEEMVLVQRFVFDDLIALPPEMY